LWSIGVLTFELLAGFPPFKHEISNWKLKGSKRKIRWSWEVLYPPEIGNDAKSFIEGLLQVDPEQRASLSECKRHMFIKAYSYKQAAGCPEEFT
jgi:serine/threonine protein kinase